MSFNITKPEMIALLEHNKNKFYIYSLNYDGIPFYVGKGKNNRIFFHEKELPHKMSDHSNRHKLSKLNESIKNDKLSYSIYDFYNDPTDALNDEKKLISKIGRNNLTNLTDGGDGLVNLSAESKNKKIEKLKLLPGPNRGKKFSDEHRQKLSNAHKGLKTWNTGLNMSEDFKEKCSMAKKGKKPWNVGIPMSEKSKEKNKQSHLGKIASDESKMKMSISQRNISDESKKLKSQRVTENNKKRIRTEEEKQKKSIKMKNISIEKVKLYNLIKNSIKEYDLNIEFPRYGKSLDFLKNTLEIIKPLVERRGGTINV